MRILPFGQERQNAAQISPYLLWRSFLLMLTVMASSTAVIMIKASTEHPMLVASYRLLIAAVVLTPIFIRELKKARVDQPDAYTWRQVAWSAVPALALAFHFSTWVIGARMTFTVNASLLVNMAPLALPFFLWVLYKEKVTRFEVVGTILALTGVVVLVGVNIRVSIQTFIGDVICLVSMLAFSCYIALGRKNGGRISLFLYVVPLYYMAGIFTLLAALPFINPIKTYTLSNVLFFIGLGIIPTVIGHSLLNYSLQYFRGQVVGIANLGQVVFSGIMGAILFQEFPKPAYYLAAVLIIAGILVGILGNQVAMTRNKR